MEQCNNIKNMFKLIFMLFIPVGYFCVHDEQCTRTRFASLCRSSVCTCQTGYTIVDNTCYKGNIWVNKYFKHQSSISGILKCTPFDLVKLIKRQSEVLSSRYYMQHVAKRRLLVNIFYFPGNVNKVKDFQTQHSHVLFKKF